MSVNWSATFGHGFKINKDFVRELSSDDEFYDGLVDNISERYPLLAIAFAGSAYGTEDMEEWVFIKGSMVHLDEWSESFKMEDKLNALNEEAYEQLYAFVADTGITMEDISWQMMLTQG